MIWETTECAAIVVKEYDHLQLMLFRGSGYLVFDKGNEYKTLKKFEADHETALKEFDLIVLKHLKDQYQDVI